MKSKPTVLARLLRKEDLRTDIFNVAVLLLSVIAVYFVIWGITGQWPWAKNPYNSYALQAQSWLEGRLDLGKDYPYLELAIYNSKYYVSFPPFPSYVLLPFAVFCGADTPDGWIALASALIGAVYVYGITGHFGLKSGARLLWTLFAVVASNVLLTSMTGWVWFIAQNMAFTLSAGAIYYALKKKGGVSLTLWAMSVGCRPLQILFAPVLLMLLYSGIKRDEPELRLSGMIKRYWVWCIGAVIVAVSYMALNYARFGSIAQFGHDYLPEFSEQKELGQFNIGYLKNNLASLLKLPEYKDGKLEYPMFNGMNMFMVSPLFAAALVMFVISLFRRGSQRKLLPCVIFALTLLQLIATCMHATMGGAHFGNRYTNDCLPYVLLLALSVRPDTDMTEKAILPLFIFGLALNTAGTIMFFNM